MAIGCKVAVEIVEPGFKRYDRNAQELAALDQGRQCRCPGGIIIARDIEAAQRSRELDGSEMGGRQSGNHGHGWHHLPQRQQGFEAFTGYHDTVRFAEPDARAEQVPHGASRICASGFVMGLRIKPSAVNPRDSALIVGDCSDHGGPCLPHTRDIIFSRPIVAARMETQLINAGQIDDRPATKITRCDAVRDRL